jgi:uncharacterized protein (DUF488 family)
VQQAKAAGRPTVFTIGHSSLEADRFVSALKTFGVGILVDVRSVPYSRFSPWFNRESLRSMVEAEGIGYRFAGDYLGGRPSDPTCYLRGVVPPNDANFLQEVDYDEVARRPWFQRGIARVLSLAQDSVVAIMCSEEDPSQCHRYHLIAQALLPEVDVLDIRTNDGAEPRAVAAALKPKQIALF